MFWEVTPGSGGLSGDDLQGSVTCQSLADLRSACFLRLSFVLMVASLVVAHVTNVFGNPVYPKIIIQMLPRPSLLLQQPQPRLEFINTVSSGTWTVLKYIHNHRNNCCS